MTRSTKSTPSASPQPSSTPPSPSDNRPDRGARAAETVVPWTATVRIDLPPDGTYRLHNTAVDKIRSYFKGYGPIVVEHPSCIAVILGIDAPDVQTVNEILNPIVTRLTRMLGLPVAAAADLRVKRVDAAAAAADEPVDPGSLVGVVEAATILQVSKQRVAQLSRRPGFPQPLDRLRATPVWRADEIRTYERARRKAR